MSYGHRQPQAAYSFPLLGDADILQCMSDLEISLSQEELKAVPKESVRRVLEQLIDMCTGITKEEMNQPAFAGLSALSYPELHDDSIPTLAFFRAA
jgi:kinetochore protein Nuf2